MPVVGLRSVCRILGMAGLILRLDSLLTVVVSIILLLPFMIWLPWINLYRVSINASCCVSALTGLVVVKVRELSGPTWLSL